MTERARRYSIQGDQDTHPLRDAAKSRATSAAERNAAKAQAKEQRLSVQQRVKAMPIEDRQLINQTYQADRKSGKTRLPYSRWLVALFAVEDEDDGLSLQRTRAGADACRQVLDR